MQPARTSLALAPLALLLCTAATAQTPIRMGQTVSGRLTEQSMKAPEDQSFYDLYTYAGKRGERVRFTLRSKDFDAYLNLGRTTDKAGGFESLDTDDDGGGGTDARVEITLPADGVYALRANTLNAGQSGAYTLQLEQAPPPAPVVLRPVAVGQTVRGELGEGDPQLGDDSFFDLYTFQAGAGDGVTATLRSSDFDAFLVLGRMNGEEFEEIESDDDKGGGTDARVSAALPAAGAYVLRVNSLYGGKTGAYTLELASGVVEDTAGGGDEHGEHDHGSARTTALHPRARPIRAGQTVSDSLRASDPEDGDGTHYQDWLYTGRRGERVVVTLRSQAFDSYLQFGRVQDGKFTYVDAQDDRGGGNDSLLAIALPEDGQYVLRVNTISKATGPYSLMLERLRG